MPLRVFSPFQLKHGRAARVIPPFVKPSGQSRPGVVDAAALIERIAVDVADAKDNLLLAKISQSHFANKQRKDDPIYKVGGPGYVEYLEQTQGIQAHGDKRVAKFMPSI